MKVWARKSWQERKGWNTNEALGQEIMTGERNVGIRMNPWDRKSWEGRERLEYTWNPGPGVPKTTWHSCKTSHDGIQENIKTHMRFKQNKSWWYPEKHQNLHEIQAKQVMMEYAKTSKPTWHSCKKSHDGIQKNPKTYMTIQDKSRDGIHNNSLKSPLNQLKQSIHQ